MKSTIRLTKTIWVLGFGLASMMLTAPAQGKIGKVCTDDVACPAGYACEKDYVSTPPTAPCIKGSSCPEPPAPTLAPTGICTPIPKACMSNADCEADYSCDNYYGKVGCTKGEACTADEKPGTCRPQERSCGVDSDCPAPLTCKAPKGQRCSGSISKTSGDGGGPVTSTTTCEPLPSVCTWTMEPCTPTSPCSNADDECVDMGWMRAPCTDACDANFCTQSCVMAEAVGKGFCFPKYIPCDKDSACPTGSLCVDLAGLEDGDITWWSLGTDTKACLPRPIWMAMAGLANTDSSIIGSGGGGQISSETSTSGVKGGIVLPQNADAGVRASADGVDASPAPQTGTAEKKGGGCTLGGRSFAPWSALFICALFGLLRRRRRVKS